MTDTYTLCAVQIERSARTVLGFAPSFSAFLKGLDVFLEEDGKEIRGKCIATAFAYDESEVLKFAKTLTGWTGAPLKVTKFISVEALDYPGETNEETR